MWKPADIERIDSLIEIAELEMNSGSRRFWDSIKIGPQKWALPPWGDDGGGFWVVGIIGPTCIYYKLFQNSVDA